MSILECEEKEGVTLIHIFPVATESHFFLLLTDKASGDPEKLARWLSKFDPQSSSFGLPTPRNRNQYDQLSEILEVDLQPLGGQTFENPSWQTDFCYTSPVGQ